MYTRSARLKKCWHSTKSSSKAVLQCLGRFLRVDPAVAHSSVNSATTLPFKFGLFGLRSASRSRDAAHSSSWADWLATVAARHSTTAGRITSGWEHSRTKLPGCANVHASRTTLFRHNFDAHHAEAGGARASSFEVSRRHPSRGSLHVCCPTDTL